MGSRLQHLCFALTVNKQHVIFFLFLKKQYVQLFDPVVDSNKYSFATVAGHMTSWRLSSMFPLLHSVSVVDPWVFRQCSVLLVASVCYVGEGGGGSFVQRVVSLGSRRGGDSVKYGTTNDDHPLRVTLERQTIIPHRVPFGLGPLLLELGILPAVVDGDQQLPDEQADEPQEQNGTGHRQQHHQDVGTFGTLCRDKKQDEIELIQSCVFLCAYIHKRSQYLAFPPRTEWICRRPRNTGSARCSRSRLCTSSSPSWSHGRLRDAERQRGFKI